MVTERSVKISNFEDFEKDVEALLRDSSHPTKTSFDRERELNISRSGSAPPTIQGSKAALGSLFGHQINGHNDAGTGAISEEEMIANPAYLSYYSYHKNMNPRLPPPPAVSKEELLLLQRLRAGAIGDKRRKELGDGGGSSDSLFSLQPSRDWLERGGNNGLVGLDGGLGARRNSFADLLQADLGHSAAISRPIPCPASRNAFDNAADPVGATDSQLMKLHNGLVNLDDLHSEATSPGLVRVQSLGSSISQSFAPGPGSSSSRSMTPDPQLIRWSPSPCLPPVGSRMCSADEKAVNFNGLGGVSSMADCSDMAASLAGLSLSKNFVGDGENHVQASSHPYFTDRPELLLKAQSDLSQYMHQNTINKSEAGSLSSQAQPFPAHNGFLPKNGALTDVDISKFTSNGQINLPRQLSSNNLYSKVASVDSVGSNNDYQNVDMSDIDFSRSNSNDYSANQRLPVMLNNQLDAGSTYTGGAARQHLNRAAHQVGSGFQLPNVDPLYAQYIQAPADSGLQSVGSLDPSLVRNYLGTSHMDLSGYQKAYLGALLAQQKLHYGMPFLNKSGGLNHDFYGSPSFGLGVRYPADPIPSSVLSSMGTGGPLRQNEQLSRFPSKVKGAAGGSTGSWSPENGLMEEGFASSLLDQFKNNKTRSFELSEIVGHVVVFSADQYGSRFIQQKLETASVEEKNKIFPEILPCARALMNDVFGNYVIQKFFEHGTEIQRKQLASQLIGHVLPLSFQMYGCRVIQKALEAVDLDQQTQMVSELDGSVMKCVHDQNGNHVIQKCIECVPQEKIQFIISSFYGQVVALSTHPYGCRVIQRVLEHCDDVKTQSIMMDEILLSVCTLAQDQYGNYVVQHVLQYGKKEERSAIISKLAGQIVKMSQHKFASNVVEKCLTYGSPEERQLLINEMLGSTDENEPLQAMMKDQFANYVVQKVLETCDDRNRELILSRIRVHLNALKRYTYGKHIVARVEKLLATGERRITVSLNSSRTAFV